MLSSEDRHVFTVSELNQSTRQTLEGTFPSILLEGEISNLSRPASGHIYLTLKDEQSQIRGAFFRNKAMRLRFDISNGMQVLVRAKVTLYAPRGDYQLVIEHMEESGAGRLQREFEALKAKLFQEGLFAPERKKPLPILPKQLGVITSPSGAAIRDVISVLERRFPALPVLIYPVSVQGEQAPGEITEAIKLANERKDCDVLLLTRGGGSLEDLWSFNDEEVARAVANSELPIVSAVGHEIDTTISDFVADMRAPTPSAAAESLSPDQEEWRAQFIAFEKRLQYLMSDALNTLRQHLKHQKSRLINPKSAIEMHAQRIDELQLRLFNAVERSMQGYTQKLSHLQTRLALLHPRERLEKNAEQLERHQDRLISIIQYELLHREQLLRQLSTRLQVQNPKTIIEQRRNELQQHLKRLHQLSLNSLQRAGDRLRNVGARLNTVSPLSTLSRGYAIVRDDQDKLVNSVKQVEVGSKVRTEIKDGDLVCEVLAIER